MSKSIFLMSSEPGTGKSIISLGVFGALHEHFKKIAYFKPIATINPSTGRDPYVDLLQRKFNLRDTSIAFKKTGREDLSETDFLIEMIQTYRELMAQHDCVFVEGLDYTGDNASSDFISNLNIAKNLGCPLMLVERARTQDPPHQTIKTISGVVHDIQTEGLSVLNLIVNRTAEEKKSIILSDLIKAFQEKIPCISVIPEQMHLMKPTVQEVAQKLNATVFHGAEQLSRPVNGYTIAAKMVGGFLNSVRSRENLLVITPGDREDLILSCLLADQSTLFPRFAAMLLTTNEKPEGVIEKIILGLSATFPILITEKNTFEAATLLHNAQYHLFEASDEKINKTIEHIRTHLNEDEIIKTLSLAKSEYVTPLLFTYSLTEQAKKNKKHIVLPEGNDVRVLSAAANVLKNKILDVTILGNLDEIHALAKKNNVELDGARFIDPLESPKLQLYAETYFKLRQHKGVTLDVALERLRSPTYFGTMMVYAGEADGMVSGATHTTSETIRPALEVIKTKPGCRLVSSVFLICLKDRVLVYGDCAINPDPDAQTLAEIALFSAHSAKQFGIDPRIAMLSYSSGTSGSGSSVDKVREATMLLKKQHPDLLVEGPIQYDAAVDITVAEKKLPHSSVAGRATVLIFPDLNAGNNTYKAVQRETDAIAIGPILQGLNKPVNDLSRGCTVKDIINTIIITALQAQNTA